MDEEYSNSSFCPQNQVPLEKWVPNDETVYPLDFHSDADTLALGLPINPLLPQRAWSPCTILKIIAISAMSYAFPAKCGYFAKRESTSFYYSKT